MDRNLNDDRGDGATRPTVSRREAAGLSLGALAGLLASANAGAANAQGGAGAKSGEKAASAAAGATAGAAPRAAAPAASGAYSAIPYSKFRMYTVVDADLDRAPTFPFPFVEGSKFKAVNTGIDEPAVQINFEDFYPGPDIVWSMFHDEVQYVTSGRAEITYHLPPLMQETGKVVAGPGSIYLLPRGARIVWRVLGDLPFRHLCVCIPNPGYPIPVADSARKG